MKTRIQTIYLFMLALIASTVVTSCQDELLYGNSMTDYPEGETTLNLTLDFEPFAQSGNASRSLNGKAMDNLDDLCLVAYDTDGQLMDGFPLNITRTDNKLTVTSVKRQNSDATTNVTAEDSTRHATFTAKLPYGNYYLYALSNLGKRDESGKLVVDTYTALQSGKLAEAVQNRMTLLKYKTEWDEQNPYNNFEMLGYFCDSEEKKSPSTGEKTNDVAVSIRSAEANLHCWLRRCVTKVTIDFDGSELLDNIYIYIKRATIHDIPKECAIGYKNAPSDRSQLHSYKKSGYEGGNYTPGSGEYRPNNLGDEIVYGETDDYHNWPKISNGDTADELQGLHDQNAQSLFLYENMQGESLNDKENKLQKYDKDGLVIGVGEEKDLMECGSYIEVEAFYDCVSTGQVSQGKIYYRFMLGKDELKDFNVERNHHLKITMKPRGNGNDVDWHIEYNQTDGFEFRDPYYVSYLYNHDSTLHFRYTPPEGRSVKTVTAEIVGNNWWPDDDTSPVYQSAVNQQNPIEEDKRNDPLHAKFNRNIYPAGHELAGRIKYLGNGFLSLRATQDMTLDGPKIAQQIWAAGWPNNTDSPLGNDRYFYGLVDGDGNSNTAKCVDHGKRVYYFNENGEDLAADPTNKGREAYNVEVQEGGSMRFNIPVFTRAKNLIKEFAYTGNNPFDNSTRTAYVRVSIVLDNNQTYQQIIRVVQVPRLTNPKGIYRRSGNNTDFNVVLMERYHATTPYFQAFESDGPWMAEVLGDENFVLINGHKTIQGNTGSNVKFAVRFNKMNRDKKVRNAIIRVRYNNFSCVHLIFVRQGYDPIKINPDGAEWYTCNQIYGLEDIEDQDPRDEGSLFKYGNLTTAIDVKSNYNPWKAYEIPSASDFKAPSSLYVATSDGSEPTSTTTWTAFSGERDLSTWTSSNIASVEDIEALYMAQNIEHGYGVLYADGATEVQPNVDDAFGYCRYDSDDVRQKKGMRGVFVYYWDGNSQSTSVYNCRNIFFPIGRSGFGHRRDWDNKPDQAVVANQCTTGQGILRYCAGQNAEMTSFTNNRPLFFELFRREGAVYWAREKGNIKDSSGTQQPTAKALDLNYYTFDVSCLPESNLQRESQWGGCAHPEHSDACFIRKVK